MSANKKKKSVPAKTDAQGWIKTRKDKYEFAEVTHRSRASISPRRQTFTDTYANDLKEIDSFPNVTHRSRPSCTTNESATSIDLPSTTYISTPPKTERLANPYMTRTTSTATDVLDESNKIVKNPKEDENGLLLEEIKKGHKLFFIYDPREDPPPAYRTKPRWGHPALEHLVGPNDDVI